MPAPVPPRSFRQLARANLAAQAAEQISLAAAPIIAVMALGAGPKEIGWLAAAQSLPFLLLAIPLGSMADRRSRRQLMLVAEGLRLLSMLGLWMIVATGHVSFWALVLLGFVGATGTVAFTVAAPALVPQLVNPTQLPRPTAGWSWRAVWPSPQARRWQAPCWARRALPARLRWPCCWWLRPWLACWPCRATRPLRLPPPDEAA